MYPLQVASMHCNPQSCPAIHRHILQSTVIHCNPLTHCNPLLRPEGASYSQISRRATTNQLYSVFLVRKEFSRDGLKMLPGGSWTDFGTPNFFQNFIKPAERNPSQRPQETSWRVPGHVLEDPKICQFFYIRDPPRTLET